MVELGHLSLRVIVLGVLLCLSPSASEAGEFIGHIAVISDDGAVGVLGGNTARLKSGDAIFRDEIVETGPHGCARLVFLDGAVVTLGASSMVRLDAVVYNSDNTASKFILDVRRGAFHLVGGRSRHDVYEIRTPNRLLRVGGTTPP
jgi:hypothetical protein